MIGPTFLPGDIVKGTVSGRLYVLERFDENRDRWVGRLISGRTQGSAEAEEIGSTFNDLVPSRLARVVRPDIDTTSTIPNPTNTDTDTHEENTMNSNHIDAAIESLRKEEAAKAVKPVYKRISKLVGETEVGEVIRITHPTNETFGTQFYCRVDEDKWLYGNGEAYKTTDQGIAAITGWVMDGAVAVRLGEVTS